MIKNFPNRPILNPGGLGSFYFVPKHEISKLPRVSNGMAQQQVIFKDSNYWYLGYASSDSLEFGEKYQTSDNGGYFDTSIDGAYPGDSSEVLELFKSMGNFTIRYVIVFVDLLGKQRIAGLDGDLFFTYSFLSKEKRYSYSFEGKCLESAPIYPYIINL
ncbi:MULTISPECIES: hypothetical protein [Sphingobacterium]|uniref:hypothetical protein n=1 Tax=Sphingobacterium TaxID=28453 RepID=UPI00257BB40A|nr:MULTISPECIES: hypothetical protein [Sphingobacterium]